MSPYDTVRVYSQYYPEGGKRIIASGSSAFIGEVDDSTVVKFPLDPGGDMSRLKQESQLFEIIGPHPRVIGYKGFTNIGLYVEFAENGNLADYILASHNPSLTIQ